MDSCMARLGLVDWSDRGEVLAAVVQDGRALQHASPDLRADLEVVLAAVAQAGCALEHASAALQVDREVIQAAKLAVLAAVARSGDALRHGPLVLLGDREVILTAMQPDRGALRYPYDLQDGYALKYASEGLKQPNADTAICCSPLSVCSALQCLVGQRKVCQPTDRHWLG